MKKTRFSIILSLVLVFTLLLTACGSASTSEPNNDQGGTTSQDGGTLTNDTTQGEKTSIRFSIWYGPGDIEVWKQVIQRFEEDHPNIKVQFEPIEWGSYWQKLQTQLASKSAPDVIGMHVGLVYNYADKQQLEGLNPLIDSSQESLADIPEPLVAEGQWPKDNPVQFALPWRFVGGPLYINKTAFDEANIPYPENGWTIDEFVDAAKKLTNDKRHGFLAPSATMNASFMGAFGTEPTTPDKLHSNFNSPEISEYMKWMHRLIFEHKVAPNPKDVDAKVDAFASGKVAMAFGGSWMIPVYRDIKDFEWDVAPIPTKDGQSKTYAGPDMISITKDSKNKEAAWEFVRYAVFNPKAQELLSTTGLPILTKDLMDQAMIDAVAAQKPEHYKVFLDGAVNNGIGYAFTSKFFEIGKLQRDAEYKILRDPNADIDKALVELHDLVEAEFKK